MSVDEGLYAWLEEALEPLGRLSMRNMMGGATLYLDATIFAILARDELWLKSDVEVDALWDAEGCDRFTVEMNGKPASMNYRRAPADAYDDPEALQRWANVALDAGRRAAAKKRPRAGGAKARSRGSPRSS
jgi:DNA transformation protein